MPYSNIEIAEYSARIGRSRTMLFRWIREGCNLRDPKSVREWVTRNEIRKTNVQRSRERQAKERKASSSSPRGQSADDAKNRGDATGPSEPSGNGEVAAAGRKDAAAALERLESAEESAHRRLEAALASGDRFRIQDAQEFWLKCSETLRRLDLVVEVARRQEEAQVPLKTAQAVVLACAEWFRASFMQFLSSEGTALMGIRDFGQWKVYAVEGFKGGLDLTVKASLRTNSPVPSWASEQIQKCLEHQAGLNRLIDAVSVFTNIQNGAPGTIQSELLLTLWVGQHPWRRRSRG